MRLPESVIIREPIKKNFLTLVFDEGDDIYSCIKEGMIQNNVKKCSVVDCSGFLKNGTINCFDRNNYKKIDFLDKEISKASGEFKLFPKEFSGLLKILTREKKPLSGTLSKGTASQNLELKFIYFE